MCELLEVCVPLCICMFRSCQFGFMGIMCILSCVGECCGRNCEKCGCDCHKKQKAVSQEDVRKDTVDAAWGDPQLKNLQVSKSLTTQPTNHNMDSGWNDHPTNAELSAMDAGWDTTNINVEQPIMEEPLLNPITHHSVPDQPVPSAPVATEQLDTLESSMTMRNMTSNGQHSEPATTLTPAYIIDDFIPPPSPPPSYEASQS